MKINFILDSDEHSPNNIEIAAALIRHDCLYNEDLREIAEYLNIYVDAAEKPRPCHDGCLPNTTLL